MHQDTLMQLRLGAGGRWVDAGPQTGGVPYESEKAEPCSQDPEAGIDDRLLAAFQMLFLPFPW